MSRTTEKYVMQRYVGNSGGTPNYMRYTRQTNGDYSQWGPGGGWGGDEFFYTCVKWIPNGTTCQWSFTTSGYQLGDGGSFTGDRTTKCPLDDLIPWLILPVGIFGFYLIRRNNLTMTTN